MARYVKCASNTFSASENSAIVSEIEVSMLRELFRNNRDESSIKKQTQSARLRLSL